MTHDIAKEIDKDCAAGNLHGIGLSAVDRLVNRLRDSYTLTNRGTGWWLAEPYKPYTKQDSEKVPDAMVDQMIKDGILRIEMLTRSMKAVLCG